MRSNSSDTALRPWLAIGIVTLSIIGIFIVSVAALLTADAANRAEMGRLIFASVLPLLGTWVGTVLAFYFARENLEAATESTARLTGQLGGARSVTEIMIPRAQIVSFDLAEGQAAPAVHLSELQAKMTASDKHRLPILQSTGAVVYVVDEGLLAKFAAGLHKDPKDPAAFTETIADLLADAEYKKALEAIAIVGPSASITTARTKMGEVLGCKDVFVTSNGKADDAVVGWITNTDLAKAT